MNFLCIFLKIFCTFFKKFLQNFVHHFLNIFENFFEKVFPPEKILATPMSPGETRVSSRPCLRQLKQWILNLEVRRLSNVLHHLWLLKQPYFYSANFDWPRLSGRERLLGREMKTHEIACDRFRFLDKWTCKLINQYLLLSEASSIALLWICRDPPNQQPSLMW